MEVSSPPGTIIGLIEQEWSIFDQRFVIKNSAGEIVLRIRGPFFTFSCMCGDVDFHVISADGSAQIGKISKQWSGIVREAVSDADFFGITFPIDLDVRMKATLLGVCFLIVSTEYRF